MRRYIARQLVQLVVVVFGISLLAFYQWLFRYLNLQLGMMTVILAHVAFSIAYVVVVVMARLRTLRRAKIPMMPGRRLPYRRRILRKQSRR